MKLYLREVYSVIADIHGLKIGDDGYLANTSFELFKSTTSKDSRVTFVYGKNGSGKSTIVNSIETAAMLHISEEGGAISFLDAQENVIPVEAPLIDSIFIFNERFIDWHIKFRRDNLDTIVLLGKQKDLDDNLKKIEEELLKLENTKKELEEEKKDLENPSSKNSKLYWLNKIKDALKGNENWAGREREIKGNRSNSAVNDDTYKQFKKPVENKQELALKFKETLEVLKKKRNSKSISLPHLALDVLPTFNTEGFIDTLNKDLEVNTLTERENTIIEVVENSSLSNLNQIKEYFENKDIKICPYCFQDISLKYKNELLMSIGKILNKEVEDYKTELEKFRIATLDRGDEYNFQQYEVLKSDNLDRLKSIWKKYIDNVNVINTKITTKQNSPYSKLIDSIDIEIEDCIKELKDIIESINKEVDEYNKKFSIEALQLNLLKLNAEMAYYEISAYLEPYNQSVDKEASLLQKYNDLKSYISKKNQEVKVIKQNLKNEKIAIDLMNKWLAYIFYSNNRLKLEYKEGQYYLLSRGESVTPDKVSVGERNAIALCYFFLSTMQGDSEDKLYKKETFLVIDDPISSLDLDNRIGLLSFLRYQLEQYISKNTNTKVLILTHDLQIFFDLEKVGKQISEFYNEQNKGQSDIRKLGINKYQLVNKQLVTLEGHNYHEYTKLLEQIYKYANNSIGENRELITIGNSMRRVLEAFSTFLFKKGIDKVTYCSEVQEDLKKYELCDYFKNYLYRFVLNGGSHMEEKVKGLQSTDFIDYLSVEEKKRTARDIILFLYCINKGHILAHLKNENEVENTIKMWIREAQNIA